MKKLLPPAAAITALALAATACGSLSATAVTVNGERISQNAIDDELQEIRDNEVYRQAYESEGPVVGEGKESTFSAAFAANILTQQIYYTLIRQELERRGLEIGADDRQAAEERLTCQVGGASSVASCGDEQRQLGQERLGGFSQDHLDELVLREAHTKALADDIAASDISDDEAEEYLEANRGQLTVVCVSHILTATREEAEAVRAELGAGADFEELAKARSIDDSARDRPASGNLPAAPGNGGDLGCRAPVGDQQGEGYVEPFAEAALDAPVGQPSEPVETQFGFHVILVHERREPPLDQVKGDLAQQSLFDLVREKADDADVDVNPKFGRFDKERGAVVPPEAPATAATTTVPANSVPAGLPGG